MTKNDECLIVSTVMDMVTVTVSMRYLKANLCYKVVTLETDHVHTLEEAAAFAKDAREGNKHLSLRVTATVEL